MKKVLIIGASVLQLPAIKKAKEMGFHVGVVDYNPEAMGIKHSDEFFNISTIDTPGILEVAKSFNPDGILTLATDMPMRSIAAVTKELGLPGISVESAIKTTDKGEMILAFKNHRVSSPWFYIVQNQDEFVEISERITYPCIIKPVDNAGSRGVILVNSYSGLNEAYTYSKQHARNGSVIIEEYMTGNEVSVETMSVNGHVNVLAITDKMTTGAPHFVEMGHSQPSRLPQSTQNKIKNLAAEAIDAVGITNGPAHVEIMVTPEGPKMIELGARMGGDNITTHLVPLSTGIDMVKATIQVALGETPDLTPKFNKGSAIRYLKVEPGILKEISGIGEAKKLPGVKEIILTKNVGDNVTPVRSSTDRTGYVIAQGDNAENAINICKEAIDQLDIKVN